MENLNARWCVWEVPWASEINVGIESRPAKQYLWLEFGKFKEFGWETCFLTLSPMLKKTTKQTIFLLMPKDLTKTWWTWLAWWWRSGEIHLDYEIKSSMTFLKDQNDLIMSLKTIFIPRTRLLFFPMPFYSFPFARIMSTFTGFYPES